MLNEDDIEQILVEVGLLDPSLPFERSQQYELALFKMEESIDSLFAERMAGSPWLDPKQGLLGTAEVTTAQIEEVDEGRLLEEVDAYDLYKLLREDWPAFDQGPWTQLSIDLTRKWNNAAAQLTGEAEGRIRAEVDGTDAETTWNVHYFFPNDVGLPPMVLRSDSPHRTGEADVSNARPQRVPRIGTEVEVRVGSDLVPVRVIGTPTTGRGMLYELQRTDTGRKLRKLRTLEELQGWR